MLYSRTANLFLFSKKTATRKIDENFRHLTKNRKISIHLLLYKVHDHYTCIYYILEIGDNQGAQYRPSRVGETAGKLNYFGRDLDGSRSAIFKQIWY